MSTSRPSFLDAYLVVADAMGSPPVGLVRKDRNVWRIMQFELPVHSQPREAFATRAEAGQRLLELAKAGSSEH